MQTPNIGDVVNVTTRYRDPYVHATSSWRENVYLNVPVIAGPGWLKQHQFCIPCDGEPYITFRVIDMNAVHKLEILDKSAETVKTTVKVVSVEGSRGDRYDVTVKDGVAVSCTCPGFQYRGTCRHLAKAISADTSKVDISSSKGERRRKSVLRKETTMSTFNELGWNERFAIIDALNPTDEQIMAALDIDRSELKAARDMRAAGALVANLGDINPQDYAAELASAASAAAATSTTTASTATVATATRTRPDTPPATASKPKREPKKRGRKGTKIQDAFAAIGTDPVPLDEFATRFSVSTNVLRQAKRFDRTGVTGRVRVKLVNGVQSIFREVEDND
jgi:hypothetical protein